MKSINKYIVKHLIIYTIFTFIVLILIYATFQSVSELSQISKFQYKIKSLILHNIYLLPTYAYEVYPIAILIASVLFLTKLSLNNEYVIIRVNGVSLKNLIAILFIYSGILTIFNYLLSELIIPKTQQQAELIKNTAIYGEHSFVGTTNIWFKLNNEFITISEVLPDTTLKNITIKHIKNNQLIFEKQAPYAIYKNHGIWELHNSMTTTIFYNNKNSTIITKTLSKELWNNKITYQLLDVLIHKPHNMSTYYLFKYMQYFKKQNQKTIHYEIEFWRKIFYPYISFIMVLFALSITPIITRYSHIGIRIFIGILIGVFFQILTRFFNYFSKVFNIFPIVCAIIPIILFLILSLISLKYNKK